MDTPIERTLIDTPDRTSFTADLFGADFPLKIEPFIFHITSSQAESYSGGYWDFFKLSNGGFYMALDADERFQVSCPNQYRGEMSGDALGIVSTLCAYSHLSFSGDLPFAETCAGQFHLLREYAGEHPEARAIFGAID
jgi:hypothetical protein